jgi:cysteine synthase A
MFQALHRAIGSTPMASLDVRFRGARRRILAKLEMGNLTGSIKDRMALHILWAAYDDGTLKPGDTIAEATSGNTGIAFSGIGRALGHPVTIFMPDWMSRERMDIIRGYGATIVPVSRAQGGFLGSIRMAEEFAASRPAVFLPRQFENPANCLAHERCTGPEILAQLRAMGLVPDALVAGVGTGGTVMGAGRFLRSACPGVRVHPLEPAESPTLTTGHRCGQHRIQGISDEFIPAIVDLSVLDDVIAVSDGDAILMAQALARIGLAVGISSGANLLGALLAQERLGTDAVVVTVFADCNRKYLSTDLFRDEPAKPGYLTPHVELLGFDIVGRACRSCGHLDQCEHWESRS